MENQLTIIKNFVLNVIDREYVDLETLVQSKIVKPKMKKNEMLNKIYQGKLIQISEQRIKQEDKFFELLKNLEKFLEEQEKNLTNLNEQIDTKNQKIKQLQEQLEEQQIFAKKIQADNLLKFQDQKFKFQKQIESLQEKLDKVDEQNKILSQQKVEIFQKLLNKDNTVQELQKNLKQKENQIEINMKKYNELYQQIELIDHKSIFHCVENQSESKKNPKSFTVKFFMILNKKNVWQYLEFEDLQKFQFLNKIWKIFVTSNKIFMKFYFRNYEVKINRKLNEAEKKLQFFKTKSQSFQHTLKQYYIYKNLYKREFEYDIDSLEQILEQICKRIIDLTLNSQEQENKEENQEEEQTSFFGRIKSRLSVLNDNKIAESLTIFKKPLQQKDISSEQLELNFKQFYNLFYKLNIFQNEMQLKDYLLENFDKNQIKKYMESLQQLLKKKPIEYNYLVDILKQLLLTCFRVYSDYKENYILKVFVVEEFEKVFVQNKNLSEQLVEKTQQIEMLERVKHFNQQKMNVQERLLNDQGIQNIKRGHELEKNKKQLKELQQNYDQILKQNQELCEKFDSIDQSTKKMQIENENLKKQNLELNQKFYTISNLLKKTFSIDENNLEKFNEQFETEKIYPLIIYKNSRLNNRLTQGKISTFHKGFLFQKGTADYPTNFALMSKTWLENDRRFDAYGDWRKQKKFLVFSGVIMDNEDNDYRMSLQGRNKDKVQLGYNKLGDLIHIIFIEENKCLVTIEDTETSNKYFLINKDKKTWLEHYNVKGQPFGNFDEQFSIEMKPKNLQMYFDFKCEQHKSQQIDNKTVSEFQGWFTYQSDQDWSRFAQKLHEDSEEEN